MEYHDGAALGPAAACEGRVLMPGIADMAGSPIETPESDLFRHYGIVVPTARQPGTPKHAEIGDPAAAVSRPWALRLAPWFGPRQLALTMNYAPVSNVVSLVSRKSAKHLDFCVVEFFHDIVEAQEAARGMEAAGVYLLGQLVQLSARDLSLLTTTTPVALHAMERRLLEVGLRLGMVLPSAVFDPRIPATLRI